MPEWLLIIAAIAGIFVIGLFFTAIDLIKDLAKWVFIGLFVFLILLIANRIQTNLSPSYSQNNSPNGDFIEPLPNSGGYGDSDPDIVQPLPEPGTGSSTTADESTYLENLAEDIDEFIFGAPDSRRQPATGQGDLVYPLPETLPDQENYIQPLNPANSETIASQPDRSLNNAQINQPTRSDPTRPATQTPSAGAGSTNPRSVPALW